jgi:hypothetical protein
MRRKAPAWQDKSLEVLLAEHEYRGGSYGNGVRKEEALAPAPRKGCLAFPGFIFSLPFSVQAYQHLALHHLA